MQRRRKPVQNWLTDREKGLVYTALSRSLESGLSAVQAVESCIELAGRTGAAALRSTRELVNRGAALTTALSNKGLLNPVDLAIVSCAEQGGRLDFALGRLGRQYEARHLRHHKLKGKLLYPAFIFVAGIFLGPLPALVTGSLSAGGYIARTGSILLLVALIAYTIAKVAQSLHANGWPKVLLDVALRVPMAGSILKLNLKANLYRTLGLMLTAGLPAHDAVAALRKSSPGTYQRESLGAMEDALQAGSGLAQAAARVPIIDSRLDIPVLAAAEAAGRLEEALDRQALAFEEELDAWYKQLGIWLPFLVYALVVGFAVSGML